MDLLLWLIQKCLRKGCFLVFIRDVLLSYLPFPSCPKCLSVSVGGCFSAYPLMISCMPREEMLPREGGIISSGGSKKPLSVCRNLPFGDFPHVSMRFSSCLHNIYASEHGRTWVCARTHLSVCRYIIKCSCRKRPLNCKRMLNSG